MKIAWPVIYANAAALLLNTLLEILMLIKVFPVIIGLMLVTGCLVVAVWCSCYLHGKLPL